MTNFPSTPRLTDFRHASIQGPPPTPAYETPSVAGGTFGGMKVVSGPLCEPDVSSLGVARYRIPFALPCEAWAVTFDVTATDAISLYLSNQAEDAAYYVVWYIDLNTPTNSIFYLFDISFNVIWSLASVTPISPGRLMVGARAKLDGSLELWYNKTGTWIQLGTVTGLSIPDPLYIAFGPMIVA